MNLLCVMLTHITSNKILKKDIEAISRKTRILIKPSENTDTPP
jgi:hypothetical protein